MPAVDEGRNKGKGKYVPPKKYTPPPPRPAPAPPPRANRPAPVPGRYTPPAPMPSNPGRPQPARTAPRPSVYGPPAPPISKPTAVGRSIGAQMARPRPAPYRPPGDADMDIGGTAAYNPRSVDDLDISEMSPAMLEREAYAANLERQRAAEQSARTSNWQRLANLAGYPLQVMGDAATALGRGTNALSDAGWNALEYAQGKQSSYDPARPRTAEAIAGQIQEARQDFRRIPGSQYMGAAYQAYRNYQNQQQERFAASPNPYARAIGQMGAMGRAIGEPIEQSFQTSSPERVRSIYQDSGGGQGFVPSVNARGKVWRQDPGLDQLSQMLNPVNVGASIAAPIAATGRFGQGAQAVAQGWNAVNEAVDPLSLAMRGAGAARRNLGEAVDDWRYQQQVAGIVPGRKPKPDMPPINTHWSQATPDPETGITPAVQAQRDLRSWYEEDPGMTEKQARIQSTGEMDEWQRQQFAAYTSGDAPRPRPLPENVVPASRPPRVYDEEAGGTFAYDDPLNDVPLPGRQQPRFDQPTRVNPNNRYQGAIQTQYPDPTADEAISRLGLPNEPQRTYRRNQEAVDPVISNRQMPPTRRFGGESQGTAGSEGLRQQYQQVDARNAERFQQYQAELDAQGIPAEARQDLRSPAYDDYFRRWQTEIQELAGADPRLSYGGWSKNHNLRAEATAYLNALRDSGRYTPSDELWKQMRRDLPQIPTQTVTRAQVFGPNNQYPRGQAQQNTTNIWQEMFGTNVEQGVDRAAVDRLLQQAQNPAADPRVQEYARKMQESLQTEQMFQDMFDRTSRPNDSIIPQRYQQDYQDRLRVAEEQLPPRRDADRLSSEWNSPVEAAENPDYEGLAEALGYEYGGRSLKQRQSDAVNDLMPNARPALPSPYGADNRFVHGPRVPHRRVRGSQSTVQMQKVIGRAEPQMPSTRTPEQVLELINNYPDIDQHLKDPEVQALLQEYQDALRQTQASPVDPNLGIPDGPRRMSPNLINRRSEAYRQNNPMQVDPRQQRLANRFVQNLQNISPLDRQEIARSIADEGGASMLLNQVGYRARSQMIVNPNSAAEIPTNYSNWDDALTDVLIGIANSEQGFRQVQPGDLTPAQLNSAINGIESRAGSGALPESERMRLQDLAYNLRGLRDQLEGLDAPQIQQPRLPNQIGSRPNPYASPRQMLGMDQPTGNPLVDALTGLGQRGRYAFEEAYAKPFRNRKRLGITPQGPGAPDPDFDNLAGQVDAQSGPNSHPRPRPAPQPGANQRVRPPSEQAPLPTGGGDGAYVDLSTGQRIPMKDWEALGPTAQKQALERIGGTVHYPNGMSFPLNAKPGIDKGKLRQRAIEAGVGAAIGTAIFGGSNLYLDLQQEERIRNSQLEQEKRGQQEWERRQGIYEQDEQGDVARQQQSQARMNADQLYDQLKSTLPPEQWPLLDSVSRARLEQIYVQNADNPTKAEADAQAYIDQSMGQEPPSWVEQEIISADLQYKQLEQRVENMKPVATSIQYDDRYSDEQKTAAMNEYIDLQDELANTQMARNYFSRWYIEQNGVTEQDREQLAIRLGVDYDEVMAATADYSAEDQQFYDSEYAGQSQSFQLPTDGQSGGGNVSPAPKLPPGRSRSAPSSQQPSSTVAPVRGNGPAVPNGSSGSSRPTRPAPSSRPERPAPAGNARQSGGGASTPRPDQVRPNPYTGVWEVYNARTGQWQKTADPVRSGASGGNRANAPRSGGFAPDPNTGYAGKGVGPSGQLESIYVVDGQRMYESQLGDYQPPPATRVGSEGGQSGRQPDPRTGYVGQTIGPSGMLETMYEIDGQVYYESQLQRYQAPDIYGQGQSQQSPVRDWNDGPRGDESLTRRHPVNGWERWIDPDGAGPLPVGWYGDMAGASAGTPGSSGGYGGSSGSFGGRKTFGGGGQASSTVNSWDDLGTEERTALVRAIQGNASWYDPQVKALMEKYNISRKRLLDLYMKPAEFVSYPRQSPMSRYL